MKVNLLHDNPGGVLSGYLNVDPAALPDDASRTACPLDNLSRLVDRGELSHLRACHVLDLFALEGSPCRREVLSHWMSLLGHGGRLTLVGTDLPELVRLYQMGRLSEGDFSRVLYRHGSLVGVGTLRDELAVGGLEILAVSLTGGVYAIEARRP